MKPINETHPSLKGKQGYVLRNAVFVKEKSDAQYETVFIPYDVQENTIDKAVLKDTIKKVENLTQKGNWVTLIQGYSSLGICSEEITLENSLKVATHILKVELGLE